MSKAKQKKDSGKRYTKEELECIKKYQDKNGVFHDYETANEYATTHYKKQEFSDQDMRCTCVAWRIVNGKYDNILKELNTKDKK